MKSHNKSPHSLRATLPSVLLIIFLSLGFTTPVTARQGAPEPKREQLLNGLKILLVPRPADADVFLKLRIHTGAAFDLAGREGMMSLLGDLMFDEQTRTYVTEELDGRLEVSVGYDALNVTLAGRATDFERLLELVRNAVINLQLTPEAIERVRGARLKTASESKPSPAALADGAIAARLFGTYPYGRATAGSPESIARVQRPDLMLMRERFLNPNNATLVIAGRFDERRIMRTLRQTFGPWRKGDRTIPATFRQPEAPDERTLIINQPGSSDVEVRLAVRGLARADRDRAVAQALAGVVRERWLAAVPELRDRTVSVRHDAFRESGVFRLAASAPSPELAARALEAARTGLQALSTSTPPTVAEIENAARALQTSSAGVEDWADIWLDEQTYNLNPESVSSSISPAQAADAQRVAARLFLHTPVASVAVGDAERLRAELKRVGGVEVFGEAAAQPADAPPPKPTQPRKPSIQLKRP